MVARDGEGPGRPGGARVGAGASDRLARMAHAGDQAGLLEGTGKGGLLLNSSVNNLAGGEIHAGSGSQVDLNGDTVTGGVFTTAGSGAIDAHGVATLVLDGPVQINSPALSFTAFVDTAAALFSEAGAKTKLIP